MTSHCSISFEKIFLPAAVFGFNVIARLLLFSIVKYRLSTPGMSRSWPRVGSPSPGRSILMTSAPNHARIWVQVGPDCTCVMSRIRTPSRAFPMSPLFRDAKGLFVGDGNSILRSTVLVHWARRDANQHRQLVRSLA